MGVMISPSVTRVSHMTHSPAIMFPMHLVFAVFHTMHVFMAFIRIRITALHPLMTMMHFMALVLWGF